MMMGSLEQDITTASTVPEIVDEILNDLDLTEEEIALENREEYLTKVYYFRNILFSGCSLVSHFSNIFQDCQTSR